MNLTICVPTYENPDLLTWCLQTMVHHAPGDYDIVVVDNSEKIECQRKTFEIVENVEHSGSIGVVTTGENLGCIGAFNAGLDAADTDFYGYVHDDAAFIPGSDYFWNNLVETASHPEVGLAVPTMSDCTGLQHFLRYDLPERFRVWCSYGACYCMRTDVAIEVGGMDLDITPSDDVNFAIKLTKAGYKIIVDRRSYLHHFRHMTFKRTRKGDDSERLSVSFNKMIRRHGVKATTEMLFHETEWGLLPITCPTWDEFEKRTRGGAEEWLAI